MRPLSDAQRARLRHAIAAHAGGDLGVAEAQYRALVAEKAATPEVLGRLATLCGQTDRQAEALRLWRQAVAADPGSIEAAVGLAGCYERAGRIEQALDAYRRIVRRWPRNVPARYLLGNLLKAQGRFDEARSLYRQVIEERPDYTQAHFTLAGIHRYRDRADPHVATMLSLLQSGALPDERRVHLAFALGKAFDDLQDYREAFRHFELGNRLRRETFHYEIESDAELIGNIIATFNRDAIDRLRVAAQGSGRPIFIVGMVRSGTSLVERILASHPTVFGAGELEHAFALGVRSFLDPAIRRQFRPLDTYPADAFEAFGRDYLAKLDALETTAPRVTDKLPFNMMMIGLIRAALPNAKIIHCVRDPRDTCLSVYRQNFATDNYRFAYELETIGRFHNLYRRLMRHWHEVYPGAIHDICYESLVRDPEPEVRRLLAACDLDWNDGCLRFHATPGVVTTASFYQVRQPLYADSVGSWRNYEEFLQPLLRVLDEP